MRYEETPPQQVELIHWALDHTSEVLENPGTKARLLAPLSQRTHPFPGQIALLFIVNSNISLRVSSPLALASELHLTSHNCVLSITFAYHPQGWTGRWLDVLKVENERGFHPTLPEFGFGDPTSYRLIEDVVNVTRVCGAVRHGAECFNFYFPQVRHF